jgi:hypothetical protein
MMAFQMLAVIFHSENMTNTFRVDAILLSLVSKNLLSFLFAVLIVLFQTMSGSLMQFSV